jgi:hypothetical protein
LIEAAFRIDADEIRADEASTDAVGRLQSAGGVSADEGQGHP